MHAPWVHVSKRSQIDVLDLLISKTYNESEIVKVKVIFFPLTNYRTGKQIGVCHIELTIKSVNTKVAFLPEKAHSTLCAFTSNYLDEIL